MRFYNDSIGLLLFFFASITGIVLMVKNAKRYTQL